MTNPNDKAEFASTQDRLDCWCGRNVLTKREYFAAMAMQAFCSNKYGWGLDVEIISKYAINQADALIKALNKEKP